MSDLVSAGKLGRVGMYERARTLGATVTIRSEPERGTVIVVDAPLQSDPESTNGGAREALRDKESYSVKQDITSQ